MNRPGFTDTTFFWGDEVERTPAHGKPTLFVVGYQTQDTIDHELSKCLHVRHIFFGANDSYHPNTRDDYIRWENVILTYLDRGFLCSLDIPFQYVQEFHEGGLCERDRFIPIIKVPIPYIRLWNYNTCIKIDDQDFAASNPGVWVHSLHDLQDQTKFTPWHHYQEDQPTT